MIMQVTTSRPVNELVIQTESDDIKKTDLWVVGFSAKKPLIYERQDVLHTS